MKIAHVISTFPPKLGGMGQVCREEAVRAALSGHAVTVFTLRYPKLDYGQDKNLPFRVVRLRGLRWGDAGWSPFLLPALRGFDAVHLHYPFYGSAQCVFWAHKLFGVKYVITYHMDARPFGVWRRAAQVVFDFIWARPVLRNAEKIITVDKAHWEHVRFGQDIPAEKIVEIPNGVDGDIFAPRAVSLAELNLQKFAGKKFLLFVGNPIKTKRLDLLLAAFKNLADPDVVLLLAVGGGYFLEDYRQMAQNLAINDRVVFIENCDDKARLAAYYNLASATVVPSDDESFSLVAAESLACGTPVVASDIPVLSARIVHGRDGLLFKAGDEGALTAVLRQVLLLPEAERAAMGQNGRAKILSQYLWKHHWEKLQKVYAGI